MFLNSNLDTTPLAVRADVEHNHTLHENVVVLSIQTMNVPHVAGTERLVIDDLGYGDDGITHVTARFGFQDEPKRPADASPRRRRGTGMRDRRRDELVLPLAAHARADSGAGMRQWRKKLFLAISRNSADPVAYFGLPADRTVITDSQIDL